MIKVIYSFLSCSPKVLASVAWTKRHHWFREPASHTDVEQFTCATSHAAILLNKQKFACSSHSDYEHAPPL